jgi:glutathionylspermidine synthase
MYRKAMLPRPDYQQRLESVGFSFHSWDNYWCEEAAYVFDADQIDELEDATQQLHQMYLSALEHVLDNQLLHRFVIPEPFHALIKTSFEQQDPSLYGRFDLAYDGKNPPKLLEYNADTPTSLLESAVAQWYWLEDQRIQHPDWDQFNSLHEKLVVRWQQLGLEGPIHFSCLADNEEDWVCTHYLMDTAMQAGLEVQHIHLEDIGVATLENSSQSCLVDLNNQPILNLFKLYPWEWLLREDVSQVLLQSVEESDLQTKWIEPLWKSVLSCKALLPILWELFPNHPYLLPAFFQDDPRAQQLNDFAKKPLYSREGANVSLFKNKEKWHEDEGPYGEEGFIYQGLAQIPCFDGFYPVLGAWVVGSNSAGLCIREDKSPITTNMSRFVPHYFETSVIDLNQGGSSRRKRDST